MQKNPSAENAFMRLLIRIGLTHHSARKDLTKYDAEDWFVPFRAPPRHTWKDWHSVRVHFLFEWQVYRRSFGFYRFQNKKCQARIPGRLLAWRWGFGWLGFEFGDRGSLSYKRCADCGSPLHLFRGWCVNSFCDSYAGSTA